MELAVPNSVILANFVWDTCALNELVKDTEAIKWCKIAIEAGHRYYITTVQERELAGVPDRKLTYGDASTWGNPQTKIFSILDTLSFCRISCITTLYPEFWLLDGSMRILEGSGKRLEMYNAIYNNNNHHKRDAIIAEATVYHGCKLISKDGRFMRKVNSFFPNTAITYDEYKVILKEIADHAD